MALNKLALVLIAGVISVGVIGGVTAVVVTRQSAETSTINPDAGNNTDGNVNSADEKPNTIPTAIDLDTLIKKFKATDVVLIGQTKKADVYAFNVKKEQLVLNEQAIKDIPTGVKVEIDSINNTSNGVLLNQGKLSVTLKAFLKDKPEETKTNEVLVEGFKASDEVLIKYLSKESETVKTAVLDLTKPKNTTTSIALTTIETLNEVKQNPSIRTKALSDPTPVATQTRVVSGLNNLFQMVNKPMEDQNDTVATELKTITIEGKVKLEKITKQQETNISLFHLVSADEDKPLKLIDTKNESEKSEALVNEVVVTNLLASNIKLNFKGYEEKEQAKFLKKYQDDAANSMFMYDMKKGLSFELKKESSSDEKITVEFNPVVIKRTSKEQELETNFVITFGAGKESKAYSTAETKDLEELKNSGMSFYIYSQKLEQKDETVTSVQVNKDTFKLGTYLNKDSISKGVNATEIEEQDGSTMKKKPIGGFNLISLSSDSFKSYFSIGKVMTVMQNDSPRRGEGDNLDIPNETWVSENWISFVGYSFKSGLENKALFIPTINLIHVAENNMSTKAELPGHTK